MLSRLTEWAEWAADKAIEDVLRPQGGLDGRLVLNEVQGWGAMPTLSSYLTLFPPYSTSSIGLIR